MNPNEDPSNQKCHVCGEAVPPGRLPLSCSGCGRALHPSCATTVERGPGWGNRKMFCADCVGEQRTEERAAGASQ